MRRLTMVALIGLLALPAGAIAQTPQTKEPLLLQLFEDVSRARQNAEIEVASCKVQVKDLQAQLQAATEKKDVKEKK